MVNSTYQNAAADIVKVSAAGDTVDGQEYVANLCQVFTEFLQAFSEKTSGYMYMAAFLVAFTELKKVAESANASDKALIEQLMTAIIGSFGSTVQ